MNKQATPVLWILVLGLVLGLGAAGCGGKPEAEPDPTATDTRPGPDTTETTPPDQGEQRPRVDVDPIDQIQDVFFEYDKYELRGEARTVLQENARYLKEASSASVLLEGHCDERGTNEYNLALGQRRADAVLEYLVDLGVERSRLRTLSYGEERPFAMGSTESVWAQNRRVHFNVTR
jgi:peptidoglycan-associated lipoprotein